MATGELSNSLSKVRSRPTVNLMPVISSGVRETASELEHEFELTFLAFGSNRECSH